MDFWQNAPKEEQLINEGYPGSIIGLIHVSKVCKEDAVHTDFQKFAFGPYCNCIDDCIVYGDRESNPFSHAKQLRI